LPDINAILSKNNAFQSRLLTKTTPLFELEFNIRWYQAGKDWIDSLVNIQNAKDKECSQSHYTGEEAS